MGGSCNRQMGRDGREHGLCLVKGLVAHLAFKSPLVEFDQAGLVLDRCVIDRSTSVAMHNGMSFTCGTNVVLINLSECDFMMRPAIDKTIGAIAFIQIEERCRYSHSPHQLSLALAFKLHQPGHVMPGKSSSLAHPSSLHARHNSSMASMSDTVNSPVCAWSNAAFSARVSLRGLAWSRPLQAASRAATAASWASSTSHHPGHVSIPAEECEHFVNTHPYLPQRSISRRIDVMSSSVPVPASMRLRARVSSALATGLRFALLIDSAMVTPDQKPMVLEDVLASTSSSSDFKCDKSSHHPGQSSSELDVDPTTKLSYASVMHLPDVAHRSHNLSTTLVVTRGKCPDSASLIATCSYTRALTPMLVFLVSSMSCCLPGDQGCHRGSKRAAVSFRTLLQVSRLGSTNGVDNPVYLFDLFVFDNRRTHANRSASGMNYARKTPTTRFLVNNVWVLEEGQNQCQKPHVLADTLPPLVMEGVIRCQFVLFRVA